MSAVLVFLSVFAIITISNTKFVIQKHGPPIFNISKHANTLPDWGVMVQKVDHFTPTDTRLWIMRYLNNSEFFISGGPLFIFLGGEWEVEPVYLMTGQVFDMAREHKGYLFYIEHRNYGKSQVLGDLTVESLRYQSADQALADIAYFISFQKKHVPEFNNSKVVVVGGSYSANLATWARLKFPHLIDIAYSSSAPLKAVEDFYDYLEVVSSNIQLNSKPCWNVIHNGIAQVEEKFKNIDGVREVSKIFRTCKLLNTQEPDRSLFFNTIASIWMGIVKYAEPGDIRRECSDLLNFNGSAIEKLGSYIQKSINGCLGGYNDFVKFYNSTLIRTNTYRQWYYQTCTEFGFFQTGTSTKQPFGQNVNVEYYHRLCKDIFGNKITPAVIRNGIENTNIKYGALNPKITRVVSVHGTVDPWHSLGLNENSSPEAPSFLIHGSAHCADLASETPNDFPALSEVKRSVRKIISEWLKLP